MIKKLTLENFKTHEKTELKFSPGINVITGDTGHGKTNILLAMKWIVDNRPRGNGCIRRGQSDCIATMEVVDNENACSIVRRRNKSENVYVVEKDGLEIVDPFNASISPPKDVSDILNLTDINIQKQRDPYFLVYSPAGQVAIYIRSITKLDEIDRAVKLLSSKIRSKKNEISHCQEEFNSTNDELVILNKINLELLESKILAAKNNLIEIEKIKEKISRIESIITNLKDLESRRITLPDNLDQIFVKVEKHSNLVVELSSQTLHLSSLINKIKEIVSHRITLPDNLDQTFVKLEKYSSSAIRLSESISKLGGLLNRIKQIRKGKVSLPENLEKVLSSGKSVLVKYNDIYGRVEAAIKLLEEIHNTKSKISDIDKQLEQLELEEKNLKKKLDVCPSCGIKLTEESRKILLGDR